VSTVRSARELARAEITRQITDEARRQLAEHGAAQLSLRAVGRALGMVSSAVYRYVSSRDDLLTALIVQAYDALGAHTEHAVAAAPPDDPPARWLAAAHAVRGWARAHPHEYALVYGSPVPGYVAPRATVPAASRVGLALIEVLLTAHHHGALATSPGHPGQAVPDHLEPDLAALVADLPPATAQRAVAAWTELFGLISFELFGHLVGVVADRDAFFDAAIRRTAHDLGLRPPG
jgi:AcrR family transcriptional regulator